MKILQLCKKFPYPPKDGESIAVTYLSRAMADQGCEITLLSLNTSKHFIDLNSLPSTFDHYREVHTVSLDNSIKRWDAFKNLFSPKSYHVTRFECPAFEEKLIQLLEKEDFDIVQLETLYLAPYLQVIKKHSDALVVMRAHNVEHEIWERLQKNIDFLPKRWYLKYLTSKLKRFEIESLENYDFLVPISDVDLQKFRTLGYTNGAQAIPIGLNLNEYQPAPIEVKTDLSLAFIGSLDWMPNLEGLRWFVRNIWPELLTAFPEIHLNIAGRCAPKSMMEASIKNLVVHGEVNCAKDFLNEHPITLVPLLSGSGMRAKILEAMALGRVVLTTTLGLEGIPAEHKREVLIADTAEDFVDAIRFLSTHPSSIQQISAQAREFVQSRYAHHQLAFDLREALTNYREHRFQTQEFRIEA